MSAIGDSKKAPRITKRYAEELPHKQQRALATRRLLLCSARAVFAREGFQHARIEDIAAKAGKTRGAFYANFKDKEDVFFAIFEQDLDRDWKAFRLILIKLSSLEQRIRALAQFLLQLSNDQERTLLQHEFRVYAIRHPRRRKRLADLHAAMRLRFAMPELSELLPELAQQSPSKSRESSLIVGAIMDGIALNRLFDPGVLSEDQALRYLTLCLRESFLASHSKYPDLVHA
jgi:AcrR family transcriptional regulator